MEILSKIRQVKGKLSYKKVLLENYCFYLKNRKELPRKPGEKNIVLLGTPEYGNLGDHLIAYAELQFLKESFGANNVLEITENDIRYRFGKVSDLIDEKSTLILQGGGNISDIWSDQEKLREKVLDKFTANRTIIMPQTVFLSDRAIARDILKKYRDNVLICAREKVTYELLLGCKKKTYLCPDIALYLWGYCERYRTEHPRNGVGICMRKDAESLMSGLEEEIKDYLQRNGYESDIFSTVTNTFIAANQREMEVEKMLQYISEKKLIITDRLHAMIMAYLADTPCIALSNSNKKVEGCYDWIKNADNVYFAGNLNDGLEHITQIIEKRNLSEFSHIDRFQKILG